MAIYPKLQEFLKRAQNQPIPEDREDRLRELAGHVRNEIEKSGKCRINFICTHNSRRSHFGQILAHLAAAHHGVAGIETYSGGMEVTEFNPRAIAALERVGFRVERGEGDNPVTSLSFSDEKPPIIAFSKLYDDEANPQDGFFAIMVCSDADAQCPFIPTASLRFPLTFDDPKEADGTPGEQARYDERCLQMASQLSFLFQNI